MRLGGLYNKRGCLGKNRKIQLERPRKFYQWPADKIYALARDFSQLAETVVLELRSAMMDDDFACDNIVGKS